MLLCLPQHVIVALGVEVLAASEDVVLVDAVVHQVTAVVVHLLPLARVDTVGPGLVHLGVDGEEPAGIAGDAVPLPPHLLLAGTTEIFRLSPVLPVLPVKCYLASVRVNNSLPRSDCIISQEVSLRSASALTVPVFTVATENTNTEYLIHDPH